MASKIFQVQNGSALLLSPPSIKRSTDSERLSPIDAIFVTKFLRVTDEVHKNVMHCRKYSSKMKFLVSNVHYTLLQKIPITIASTVLSARL